MIDGYLLNMRVFGDAGDGGHRAPGPPGEAAEASGARQASRRDLIDECVGAVQAAANMLAAVGATQGEVDAAIGRMDERNADRGRL